MLSSRRFRYFIIFQNLCVVLFLARYSVRDFTWPFCSGQVFSFSKGPYNGRGLRDYSRDPGFDQNTVRESRNFKEIRMFCRNL